MKILKTQSGQSLIEASLLIPFIFSIIFISIFFILEKIFKIKIDDDIENYFLCRHSEKSNCLGELQRNLKDIPIKNISFIENDNLKQLTIQYEIFKNKKTIITKQFSIQQENSLK